MNDITKNPDCLDTQYKTSQVGKDKFYNHHAGGHVPVKNILVEQL